MERIFSFVERWNVPTHENIVTIALININYLYINKWQHFSLKTIIILFKIKNYFSTIWNKIGHNSTLFLTVGRFSEPHQLLQLWACYIQQMFWWPQFCVALQTSTCTVRPCFAIQHFTNLYKRILHWNNLQQQTSNFIWKCPPNCVSGKWKIHED